MAVTPKADWERVEAQFRAGSMSLREIATAHAITEGAIRKRAKRDGWTRDLTERVKAKADELVRVRTVRDEVRKKGPTPTEAEVIESAAEDQATVRIAHRTDITRMRRLVLVLLSECEAEAGDPELFENLGDILRNPDEKGQDRLNEAYRKAISLPQRIKGVKELADALRVLVAMEREAYGLESEADKALDALAGLAVRFVEAGQK